MPSSLNSIQRSINVLPDAAIVIDQQNQIVATNDLVVPLLGYQPSELIGQPLKLLLPARLHKKQIANFHKHFQDPAELPTSVFFTLFALRKGGKEIDIDVGLAPISTNQEILVIATIRDVTELKELERNLLRKNEELSLMNTQLERFGYVIAHDLKSPLLNVHALVNLINRELREVKNEKLKNYTKALDETLKAMMNLITGVADYSKAGLAGAAQEDVDLNEVMNEVKKLVPLPPEFQLNVKGPLPVIKGNKTKILQVFLNLVNNAIKYNDKPIGKIVIQAHSCPEVVLISIADNGPGVPVDQRQKVFDLFKKGNIEKEGSQGIGLAVVKKIIEDRGGGIIIDESTFGGAEFYFSWPARTPAEWPEASALDSSKNDPMLPPVKDLKKIFHN